MGHAKHDSRAIANKLIGMAIEARNPLTPLQLIKLVYFCHGWMLGIYEKPLARDYVEAWRYGPVHRAVYRALKGYRDAPVDKLIAGISEEDFNGEEEDLMQQVYDAYGSLSGIRLSSLTHAPGTPWDTVWRTLGSNSFIPYELIQEHYAGMIKKDDVENS